MPLLVDYASKVFVGWLVMVECQQLLHDLHL